jgi:uncharacterized protein
MVAEPSFEVRLDPDVRAEPGTRLIVGTAGLGVAGLTATDYLVNNVETTQIGHVRTRNLPDITPFSEGQPRHPLRLFSTADSDLTVLLSEVFLPVSVSDPLAAAVIDWADTAGIEEITVLYGAPFPHADSEHRVYHVATEAYRQRHFAGEQPAIEPLPGGFLDGLVGELVTRSLEATAPRTGVLLTPTHTPGPDLEAAIRLLDALEPVYGLDVDETELRDRATRMAQYYEDLAERMQTLQAGDRDYPSDRMYM